MAKAAKKSGRATSEGLVMAAVSADGKTVAMSALLCETDFVARGEQFEALAAKVAQMSGVDPEEALHCACDKFNRRFRYVEEHAGEPLSACGGEKLIALWQDAKKTEES